MFLIDNHSLNRILGATPLVPVLRQVLKDKRNQVYERKLLILIATDGVPTNDRERPDIETVEHVLRNERKPTNQIPVTIIACTGRVKICRILSTLETDCSMSCFLF
jgi:hypothetical protein